MDTRRRSSIVTTFLSTSNQRHVTNRRRSCAFADDLRSFTHAQYEQNMYGDHGSPKFINKMRRKGSLPSVISDAMLMNPPFKRSNSNQFTSVYCPPRPERGYVRRSSCTLTDSIMQSKQMIFPGARRRSIATMMSGRPNEPGSRRYTSSSRIPSSVEHRRNSLISGMPRVFSSREKYLNKRRQSCPVNEIVIRTDASGVVSIQEQVVESTEQMVSQFDSNLKLNRKCMYERASQSKLAAASDHVTKSDIFQDMSMGVHGTRRVVLSEKMPTQVENKCGETLPRSQSYPHKMASCLAVNRERLHGVSEYDQINYSSLYERTEPENEQLIAPQTNRERLDSDEESRGTDTQGDGAEQNKSPTINLVLPPNITQTMPVHFDQSHSAEQNRDNTYDPAALFNQNASGQSRASTRQAAACCNNIYLPTQQQLDRNEPVVWKRYLSPVNESADDDNDLEPDTRRQSNSSAPIRIANARMALTNNGTEMACSALDSSQIPTGRTNERNVHIFLTPSKNKHKSDTDTVLISFCVSPACITFSVLQINFSSGQMRGGIPYAKVLIMDNRETQCSENYHRQNFFIVELGQEVHFCFPDLIYLEYMSLSIEMFQQQNKKEKCLGCIEIRLSDHDKLTDVIMWKTLQKPIRQSAWGSFFSCFSGRASVNTSV